MIKGDEKPGPITFELRCSFYAENIRYINCQPTILQFTEWLMAKATFP